MQTQPATDAPASAAQLIADAAATLAAAGIDTARLDAEVLLAVACDMDRTRLYARLHEPISHPWADAYASLLARRHAREPLAYIVGHQEFWSLDFSVTPDVLIPRPETELVVEVAIDALRASRAARPTLCDLGTGSGCIAIAIAREMPSANLWGLDVSPAALAVARFNAARHRVESRIHFLESDAFSALPDRRYEVIVCNPPYVSSAELQRAQPELRWEPRSALDGGVTGLDVIRRVLPEAYDHLADAGALIMEIGADQAAAADSLARAACFSAVSVRNDYAGRPRVVVARR